MENLVNPTRDPELLVFDAVSIRSYVPYHNWLLEEDILLKVCGSDKNCIQTILSRD